jgi:hypothetical protein
MQINIEKRHLVIFGLIITGLIAIISGIFVLAYNSAGNPDVFGHSANEIEGLVTGEGSSMNLPGTGTYSVLIFSTYFSCQDVSTDLLLDENVVKSYAGYGGDSSGCDQNTIQTKLTGINAGSHTWSISRGEQHSFVWTAFKE